MRLVFAGFALALLATAVAAPAAASMVAALDLDELVDASDHVVVVDAVWESSRWNDAGQIVTDVRLVVEDSMKGPLRAGDEAILTVLGGAMGDIAMRVPGEAHLPVGSRALVFGDEGHRGELGRLHAVGMAQGVLPVEREGGVDMVAPGGRGLALVRRAPDGSFVPAAAALGSRRPLDEIRAAIVARVRGER